MEKKIQELKDKIDKLEKKNKKLKEEKEKATLKHLHCFDELPERIKKVENIIVPVYMNPHIYLLIEIWYAHYIRFIHEVGRGYLFVKDFYSIYAKEEVKKDNKENDKEVDKDIIKEDKNKSKDWILVNQSQLDKRNNRHKKDKKTIDKHLKEMEELGLIEIKRGLSDYIKLTASSMSYVHEEKKKQGAERATVVTLKKAKYLTILDFERGFSIVRNKKNRYEKLLDRLLEENIITKEFRDNELEEVVVARKFKNKKSEGIKKTKIQKYKTYNKKTDATIDLIENKHIYRLRNTIDKKDDGSGLKKLDTLFTILDVQNLNKDSIAKRIAYIVNFIDRLYLQKEEIKSTIMSRGAERDSFYIESLAKENNHAFVNLEIVIITESKYRKRELLKELEDIDKYKYDKEDDVENWRDGYSYGVINYIKDNIKIEVIEVKEFAHIETCC